MFKRVFETDEGKQVLDSIKRMAGLGHTCFTHGDPYETAFREGKQATVFYIMNEIKRSGKSGRKLERLTTGGDTE